MASMPINKLTFSLANFFVLVMRCVLGYSYLREDSEIDELDPGNLTLSLRRCQNTMSLIRVYIYNTANKRNRNSMYAKNQSIM
ncbi:hypothetical protein QBC37DRAFT_169674 [Rhypophila decipiens]|uniref:Secreted protein n=1 Tax=Rhypophila decipiens TaxID=261697 RepID=A0AAN6Y6S6_9PEZI|nr:hypothetical protein QBC37DRAFT_169674 [Rhypophila decipiens]